jgi:hypothetical protein
VSANAPCRPLGQNRAVVRKYSPQRDVLQTQSVSTNSAGCIALRNGELEFRVEFDGRRMHMTLFPSGSRSPQACTLQKNVAAVSANNDLKSSGFLIELPSGVQVEVCGVGYNDRTVEVRFNGEFYIVFAQDIELDSASN